MLVLVLLSAVWLICGCVGAVLLDEDQAEPINLGNIALGPVAMALGIMCATEAND
jgi:hypothetical protein